MKTDYDFNKPLPRLSSTMNGATESERHSNAFQEGFTHYLNYCYVGPGEKKESKKAGYYTKDMTEAVYWQRILRNLKLTSEIVALAQDSVAVSAPVTVTELINNIVEDLPPEAFTDVPTDLSQQIDHYAYGTPKIPFEVLPETIQGQLVTPKLSKQELRKIAFAKISNKS